MFGTSTDYHELNAGAHRNVSVNLNAPTLTWYLGFWIANIPGRSTNEVEAENDHITISQKMINIVLDTFILHLCKNIATKASIALLPCINNKILLFSTIAEPDTFEASPENSDLTKRERDIFESGARSVTLKFKWIGLCVTMRFEIQTEYFTITNFIEIDSAEPAAGKGLHLYSSDDDMSKHINSMLAFLNPEPDSKIDPKKQAEELNDYFFAIVWKKFYAEIFDITMKGIEHNNIFESVFADFRGMILSDEVVQFRYDREFFAERKPPSWGKDAKCRLLPLVRAHHLAPRRKYESAINYLLDGRALYISTLAPQIPNIDSNHRLPLQYIIYVHQKDVNKETIVNKWQLGRLVSQLHTLGSIRLAAIKDIKLPRTCQP